MKFFAPFSVILIICLSYVVIGADKFKCYECKSVYDKKCIDNPKDTNKVECQRSRTCAKYTMIGPTGTFVERGCGESLTWDKVCYTAGINTSYNAVVMSYETCTKEKCNNSSTLSINIFILLLVTTLISAIA